MAKYLSYGGLEKVWGLAKNYFPTVKTATVNGTEVTWQTNTGVSAGNVATFAVDANGLVSLQGITTSSLASSHTHDLSIAADSGTSALTMAANTKYKLTAGGSTFIFTTPPNPSIGNGTFQVVANSGTSGVATPFTANGSSAIALNFINGNNTTAVVTAVSNKAPTITFNHNAGSAASVTDGTAANYALNTEYTVLTGISYTVDSYGHITGISTTRQKIKDTNTTYSRNVSHSSAAVTAGTIPVWNAAAGADAAAVLKDGYTVDTATLSSSETAIPTSKAVSDAITGLSGAMHFCGTTTTALTDGATTATLAGSGLNKTTGFVAGDVVIYSNKEFVWTGSAWELLGDEGSYALKTVTITGTGELGGGGAISSNQTITHNTSGATAGTYGPTQTAAVSGTNNTKINVPKITVNEYGHVTSIENIEYTSVDHTYTVGSKLLKLSDGTNTKTAIGVNENSSDRTVTFSGDSWVTPTVGGSDSAATVSFAHADPGTGSAMTTTEGTASAASAGTTYAVVTGVTISKDSKGHITGVSTTRQNVVSNSTYSLPVAKYNTLGGVKPAYSSTKAATLTTAAATNTTTPTIAAKTTTSGRYYAVEADKDGILFVNVPWASANNAKLQVKGSASDATATDTGFTANASSAGVITFARSGASVASVTTSGGTVTINGVDSLKNPNSFTVGTKPSSTGTATNVVTYDGSASGKAIYFSTANASNTNVKFAVDANGFITGTVTDSGNTLNTAGSTDTSSKIFLIGATSQAANPQTYSHDTAYVGTDGCLYSNSTKVMVAGDVEAITDEEINTVCVI